MTSRKGRPGKRSLHGKTQPAGIYRPDYRKGPRLLRRCPYGEISAGRQGHGRIPGVLDLPLPGRRWLLREIEQAGESDCLKDENFVEMLTDQTVQGIYGEKAGKEGKDGPWLEKGIEKKATRTDRLLNFLAKTDKLWNRQAMTERAREVFLAVFLHAKRETRGR